MSVHVIPLNDERAHVRLSTCWCNPIVEWTDSKTGEIWREPLITHNAADCREVVEWATNTAYGQWEVCEGDDEST